MEELLRSTGSDHQAVIRHLLQCETCRDRLLAFARPAGPDPRHACSQDYGEAFEAAAKNLRHQALALACEREEAAALLAELTAAPREARAALLREKSFQTWGLMELLIDRSWESSLQEPVLAGDLAGLALQLGGLLSPTLYRPELVEDLRARAAISLGNARRLTSDLAGAEEALAQAAAHLARGTGDPIERALLLDREASLRRAQRRFPAALDCATKAVWIFIRNGETHRAGRTMVNLSLIHSYAGETEQSIEVLSRAIEMIDGREDPRTLLCARHNLAGYLAEAGRYREAQRLFERTRPLYREFPDAWTQNRRCWLRGKISYGMGHPASAESFLRAARAGFLAEGIPYDTALVSLDLALLFAQQGRAEELESLAVELIPLFASRHIHREALAALSFLQQALEAKKATIAVVTRVAGYLRKAQHDPELRWEGEAGVQ